MLLENYFKYLIFTTFTIIYANCKTQENREQNSAKIKIRPGHRLEKNDEINEKKKVIKEMMKHAWSNYEKYAWGHNELRPISKTTHANAFIFGNDKLGATIVDALDTLYIMNFTKEFQRGRDWIEKNFNLDNTTGIVSGFEVNIRFVGGLLSCYALTNDTLFLDKAEHVATRLLPAFSTNTGIPRFKIPLNRQHSILTDYTDEAILAEFGSYHLEFVYLSHATKYNIFKEKVYKLRDVVERVTPADGLYRTHISTSTGIWTSQDVTLGGSGDSFYEYLLKAWIQSGKQDIVAKDMFLRTMNAVRNQLIIRSKNGLYYVASRDSYYRLNNEMGHLTCFIGGLFALESVELTGKGTTNHLNISKHLANTCHESYIRSATKIGPEDFTFTNTSEAKSTNLERAFYILRPEVVETYFYLWRITKEQKYRDWAWEVVNALQTHCRVEYGFSGISNVYDINSTKDDIQQTFFLAETLKYLYLIYNDDLLPLDQWVFNTEGHPLPILKTFGKQSIEFKREVVKDMMIHAWNNYEKYSWGFNELRPVTKSPNSQSVFGSNRLGATIVDALDTLYIMNLTREFQYGSQWVKNNLNLGDITDSVPVSEMNLHFVGGLLSCYALTKDKMFLKKAYYIASHLLPAFNTNTSLPHSRIIFKANKSSESLRSSTLSEIGSFHLEFQYLSAETENEIFVQKVNNIRNTISENIVKSTMNGLYLDSIDINNGSWSTDESSIDNTGIFYEYLLKSWIQSNRGDNKTIEMILNMLNATKTLIRHSINKFQYLTKIKGNNSVNTMSQRSCLASSLFALASQEFKNERNEFLSISEQLAKTCHESCIRSETKLGPEKFIFNTLNDVEFSYSSEEELKYSLRAEVVEAYFYLWRITKDEKYRDWAWDAVIALQKHCKVDNGYTGVMNVNNIKSEKENVQQSYFLGKTLKYLYLIFSNDDLLPLNQWVFNAAGHPFPILKNEIFVN